MNLFRLKYFLVITIFLSSCNKLLIPVVTKAPKNKPYQAKKPDINIIGGQFSKLEREAVKQRLYNSLDDSAKVNIVEALVLLRIIRKPVAFDTSYANKSIENMLSSMHHLGYYNAQARYDTVSKIKRKGRQVTTTYTVTAGKPTLIDTINYRLKIPELQQIATSSKNISLLQKNTPVTKIAVLSEVSRLVDSFRNNGYYRFTSSELRVLGDSSIAALTTISDDPFEQLKLLEEAQKKKDSPTVKLNIVLNTASDSFKLLKYYINKIYVLSDYRPNDLLQDTTTIWETTTKNIIHRYHQYLFKTSLLERNITLRSGEFYKQDDYYKTLNNLSKLAVWQNINIKILENLDKTNNIDLVIELVPAKKLNVGGSLDLSFSSSSNNVSSNGGSLFGFATEFSVENKNLAKEAIKMKNSLRAGVEYNNRSASGAKNNINSTEISYTNSIQVPRLVLIPPNRCLLKWINNRKFVNTESFINTNLSYNNRLDYFNLQSVNFSAGWAASKNKWRFTLRPLIAEFSYLYNQTSVFETILQNNPFLRYSYNTSFVLGAGISANWIRGNQSFKANFEQSGALSKYIQILNENKKKYIKIDLEYKNIFPVTKKIDVAFRAFLGIGKPIRGDSALPFFKQFFSGGSNSMRGWPVRGIGRGGQKLPTLSSNLFNDRTGDVQIEFNGEFRHELINIASWLKLKGAVFVDIGNVWNINNSKGIGIDDETQFHIKNLYKQLGMSAGYGFRLDFTYAVLRLDFGFRFKRPETSDVHNGWKVPDVSFADIWQKILSRDYREWRYENFNFSIGINYPF
jgi:outer membrane protein insertion porin family